ncbi:hypothetical protein H5410_055669 [Solanum commersonii]|uniref:Uncharacterized protein n=1 Tax=Solanum commersonii TaxID=4109 RepID=A0A9J5WJT0_SOLCO|nr:hypothetical protein H5410_055669 [Solanum commersonii]
MNVAPNPVGIAGPPHGSFCSPKRELRHRARKGVDANWVHDSLAPIKKTSFNLAAKLWWSIARAKLSPTIADNHLTRDRVVMVACLMVGEYIVPLIEEVDALIEVTKTVDACLIRDEANSAAP